MDIFKKKKEISNKIKDSIDKINEKDIIDTIYNKNKIDIINFIDKIDKKMKDRW